ncbi:MAG: GAF domain-containing sensor histidine kinase [Cyanobacteria bacterium J06623_7]
MEAVDLGLPANNMTKPKNQLFCRLDNLAPAVRRQQRTQMLNDLGLMASEALPILEEITQKAASFSSTPIAILGLAVEDELWFKSAVGLSSIDLTNQLAVQRKIPLHESFSAHVIDSQQPLSIANTLSSSTFTRSILTQHYGIRAYLGVPLMTATGICIGTLEVMDWVTRDFDDRDIDHLSLLAHWYLGEFERHRLIEDCSNATTSSTVLQWHNARRDGDYSTIEQSSTGEDSITATEQEQTSPIKLKLLAQLTQELKNPLTSVIGMASVLHREVYGPLTIKQREYLEIIHDSGKNLISLVDEIVSLGVLSDRSSEINLTTVDIEMLCQQVINSLGDLAKQYQQVIYFSIEPGNRLWTLDKEKVRQALYYLIASILEMSEPGGEIKIHVSQRDGALNIAIVMTHPWLGNDFSETKLNAHAVTQALELAKDSDSPTVKANSLLQSSHQVLTSSALMMVIDRENKADKNINKIPRDLLGLLFCCHLTELHGGNVVVQGSPRSGYRYLLQISAAKGDSA